MQHENYFSRAPWGPGEGSKGKILNFNNSQFKRFLYQTLCVFSQMKDIKHIKLTFYSVAWVMPKGWDFVGMGCPGGLKHSWNIVMWHVKLTGMTSRKECKFSPYGQTGDLGVRSKGHISLNFSFKVNFKDFYTKLCVCSHK